MATKSLNELVAEAVAKAMAGISAPETPKVTVVSTGVSGKNTKAAKAVDATKAKNANIQSTAIAITSISRNWINANGTVCIAIKGTDEHGRYINGTLYAGKND